MHTRTAGPAGAAYWSENTPPTFSLRVPMVSFSPPASCASQHGSYACWRVVERAGARGKRAACRARMT